jgi:hypothetical protein
MIQFQKGQSMLIPGSIKLSSSLSRLDRFRPPPLGRNLAALLILVPFAIGQTQAANPAAGGCGPAAVHFVVKIDKHSHPIGHAQEGKVLVYFIQDDTQFDSRPRPTTRIGIDGAWVGATKANSYFYVSVNPGEHDLCSSWQSAPVFNTGHTAAAARFTAVGGQTYYFLVRDSYERKRQLPAEIELKLVDDAEGQLLASQFSLSTSHPNGSRGR